MNGRERHDGFDPSLIDEMLALSPAGRIARHDQALELVLALERAGRKLHGLEPRSPQATDPRAR